MTKDELIAKLQMIALAWNGPSPEQGHVKADNAVLEYINDPEIKQAYDQVRKWYS